PPSAVTRSARQSPGGSPALAALRGLVSGKERDAWAPLPEPIAPLLVLERLARALARQGSARQGSVRQALAPPRGAASGPHLLRLLPPLPFPESRRAPLVRRSSTGPPSAREFSPRVQE